MPTRSRSLRLLIVLLLSTLPLLAQAPTETITIDAAAPSHPFPHYWEQMFGSGRAVLSLRDAYRRDLRTVRQITGFQYVRFHAILDDEVGVYDEDKQGKPIYNFSYVDQIYDGLLANSVKPFVELSFMPSKLAARQDLQSFWYHPNVAPPKDYAKWDDLITQFTKHLVDRYGIDEVANWYFEVWNEPNLDFWTGTPKQESYFELYDHTARDIKAVSPRLRVGGPATCAGGVGPGDDPARGAEKRAAGLRFHPHLRQRQSERCFSQQRKDPARPDGLPRGEDGARADQSVAQARPAAHRERVQCRLRQRSRGHRLHLHGPVARDHHQPVRRPGADDVLSGPSPTSSKSRASSSSRSTAASG